MDKFELKPNPKVVLKLFGDVYGEENKFLGYYEQDGDMGHARESISVATVYSTELLNDNPWTEFALYECGVGYDGFEGVPVERIEREIL